tara:strand:- start:215 stop:1072 length:858 start_codon:yes stop_codon:yes gene_type:complete
MNIYKKTNHILNLISSTKKIILLILIVVNGLGFVYHKNLKKTYVADIIITAIPNEIRSKAVDVFSIFEIYFRDPKNLDNWINIQKKQNGNKDVLINRNEILGYSITESQINIYNKVVFKNAVTLQRSIYLRVPGEDPKVLKNIFLYSLYIEELLNYKDELEKKDERAERQVLGIYKVLNNLRINFQIDLEQMNDKQQLLNKYFSIINGLLEEINKANSLNEVSIQAKSSDFNFVKVSPPKSIHIISINPNKIYFSTIFLSIFLIFSVLIYKDFTNSSRKSLKLDK